MDQGAGDRQPLSLAAGKLLGPQAALIGQADRPEHVVRVLSRHTVQGRERADLLTGGQPLEER